MTAVPSPDQNPRDAARGIAEDWVQAHAELEKLTARVEELADELRKMLRPGEKVLTSSGAVVGVVKGTWRFDPRKAAQILTPDQYAFICEPAPNAARAKALLHPALLGQVQTQTRDSVRLL